MPTERTMQPAQVRGTFLFPHSSLDCGPRPFFHLLHPPFISVITRGVQNKNRKQDHLAQCLSGRSRSTLNRNRACLPNLSVSTWFDIRIFVQSYAARAPKLSAASCKIRQCCSVESTFLQMQVLTCTVGGGGVLFLCAWSKFFNVFLIIPVMFKVKRAGAVIVSLFTL